MSELISQGVWDNFRKIIRDAHDTLNQDMIIWRSFARATVSRFNEDDPGFTSTDITLKCLIGYNYFRTWPMTRHLGPGELDEENMIVLFNKDYLGELGYLTTGGYFNLLPDRDLFLHRNIVYKPEGDTFLSQANDDPLFLMLILRREDTPTGTDPRNQS